MQLETNTLEILRKAITRLDRGFDSLPECKSALATGKIEEVLQLVADRMQDNYPYFHPLYAGQMLKPPHPVARLAYMLALWINPNNHALDGGRASSQMEKEAIHEIAGLFNWSEYLGHLTGGGTMANLESLWIAGQLHPGTTVVASEMAHYTHARISKVLQLDFRSVSCDSRGRMDLNRLEDRLKTGQIGTVVATIGTTGLGAVDPLPEILELRKKYKFRIHADAAYGGYFTLAENLDLQTRQALDQLPQVDSIVIDPHKHGLQPYGCGCVLFRDPGVGRFYKHDSPYTYFSSSELHLGEISLECSRPGAAAVALWATQKVFPLTSVGEFATGLSTCRRAALQLYDKIQSDTRFLSILPPELDIIVFAPWDTSASRISERSQRFFDEAARRNLHLATITLSAAFLASHWPGIHFDQEQIACLRSCLMKPEHEAWLDRIWNIVNHIAELL